MLCLNFQHALSVVDRRFDLKAVTYDACIINQPLYIFVIIRSNGFNLKVIEGLAVMLASFKNGDPV